jgi:LAO/AO transport system kinase
MTAGAQDLAFGVRSGEAKAMARAMSVVENDADAAAPLLAALHPHTGRADVIGVTGPPGAGKSTLVDRLTTRVRRDGKSVGVVAVDPTSPWSGGAILGDRIRMQDHATDAGVFIRSMASRGQLGGLSAATGHVVSVLDAAGKDVVFVETVGVGQGEVEIASTADVTLVVLVPGLGDEIQTLKAGLLEIADVFVVNKADREGSDRLVAELSSMLGLVPGPAAPPIVKTTATRGEGIDELWAAIGEVRARAASSGEREKRRRDHMRRRIEHLVVETIKGRLLREVRPAEMDGIVDLVLRRELDPIGAADRIVRGLQAEKAR